MAITTWRPIKSFPLFEMNSMGEVRRIKSKKKIPRVVLHRDSLERHYQLTNGDDVQIVKAKDLIIETFPEMLF